MYYVQHDKKVDIISSFVVGVHKCLYLEVHWLITIFLSINRKIRKLYTQSENYIFVFSILWFIFRLLKYCLDQSLMPRII